MRLPPFALDRWLAAHEFADPPIRFNLASSTGPPWTLGELLSIGGAGSIDLEGLKLSYAPPQGSARLRERVAALHRVDPDDVVVMTGASEALMSLVCHCAPDPGARTSIVLPRPCYPAIPVLARAWGVHVREYVLEAPGFTQTADLVMAAVAADTRAVFVNSPHNPTGAIMSFEEQTRLSRMLEERGIPLIVDEVYHPLYFSGDVPSAAALSNTIVLGDFAKALSLPGLRIGWLIDRDAARREALIDARSYFTISGSPLTEAIGALALEHADVIWRRLREVALVNLDLLDGFMRKNSERLEYLRPAGGTTCFPRLRSGGDARPLCEALASAGVLLAPGDCFGAQRDGYAEALMLFDGVLRSF